MINIDDSFMFEDEQFYTISDEYSKEAWDGYTEESCLTIAESFFPEAPNTHIEHNAVSFVGDDKIIVQFNGIICGRNEYSRMRYTIEITRN